MPNEYEGITPNELGCLGEDEVDPGVKEGSAPVKKSVPLSFSKIPFEKRKRYKKFWDEFFDDDAKDMSFEEFCVEMYLLESPLKMQYDLQEITAQKQGGYRQKAAIDHTINKLN